MNVQSTTLTSLVLLKNLIDTNKEYHDYFIPFIEQIFTDEDQETFEDHEIQVLIESDFGLRIPKEVVLYILKRMERQKTLKKDGRGFSRGPNFKESDIKKDEKNALRQIEDVISALIAYANIIRPDELSESNAMEIIQKFLEKFQIDCIKSYTQGKALPDLRKMELWESDILVGLFLVEIYKNNRPLFEKFMVLVQGNMLANALVSTDTSTPPKTYKKTTFYFDTPNLLNVLGYSGEDKKNLAQEMIATLRNLDGRIAVFEHTIEEAQSVLHAAANDLDHPLYAHKPLNSMARQNGWGKSDLIIRADRIKDDINDLNINIRPTPRYDKQFQIDENELENILIECVFSKKQNQNSRLQYDINSIRSIYCLRRANSPRRLEDANAILVTFNKSLARAAYKYAQHHHGATSLTSIIDDYSLTNLAWLKAPNFDNKLIDAQTISLAYSAMRLSEEELGDLISKTDKLAKDGRISHDDLQILRSSPEFEQNFAYIKASGADIQNEQSISSVVEKTRKIYSAEADAKQVELERLQKVRKKEKKELDQYREENRKKIAQRQNRCKIASRIISNLIIVVVVICILLSLAYDFYKPTAGVSALFTFYAAVIIAIYHAVSIFVNIPKIKLPSIQKGLQNCCNRYWGNKK